ncbi:MAG: ABC transporter substrate-binding protein [Tissierellia bacterium]|nr:ABC transporter substrate-binding protein [Tissierellia bacterium]
MRKIVLTLDWEPNTNHSGFYMAKANGLYEKHGIDLTIHGEAEGETLLSGSDFICAPQASYVLGIENPIIANLTGIASITQINDSGIVSLKENDITSPKKLMTKRLTHWNQEWFHTVLNQVINEDGGDYSKVDLVPMDVSDIVTTLNTVGDATWVYKSWEYFELLDAGYEVNYFAFPDLNPVFNYCSPALFVQNTLIDEDPELISNFLSATEKGYQMAKNHPDEAIKLLSDLRPNISQNLWKTSQEYVSNIYLNKDSQWGRIEVARWNNFSKWMYENNLVNRDLSIKSEGFTNEFFK